MLNSRVRPGHAKHHGLVLPKDDPFWDTHYPPNAWNCRCKVNAYTKSQLEKRGYEVSKVAPESFAHKDWAYNPGFSDTQKRLMDVYKNKANKIEDKKLKDKALKEAYKISDELTKRLATFKSIQKFFKTPLKDAKISKKKISIAKATDEIKKAFNDDKLDQIYLSEWTIASHKHHKNITTFDYYLMMSILKKKALKIKQSDKEEHLILYYYFNHYYRVVLKKTKKNEIFMQSLVKGKNIKKELKTKETLQKP